MKNNVLSKQIRHVLDSVYPSHIYTVSNDRTLTTSLSQLCYIDERHLALSVKIFTPENVNVFVKILDPDTFESWEMELRYVRSENKGPIFEQMAAKLASIGSLVGMEDLFYLKAADIYKVVKVRCLTPIASVS